MEEEESKMSKLTRIGTLGGKIKVNQKLKGLYGAGGGNMTKERLFGQYGPLHPGMPHHKGEIAATASMTDTRLGLIRELTDQSGLTKREAENVVNELIAQGKLVEINHPDLGKVLVFKEVYR